jgi:hypothetical protein
MAQAVNGLSPEKFIVGGGRQFSFAGRQDVVFRKGEECALPRGLRQRYDIEQERQELGRASRLSAGIKLKRTGAAMAGNVLVGGGSPVAATDVKNKERDALKGRNKPERQEPPMDGWQSDLLIVAWKRRNCRGAKGQTKMRSERGEQAAPRRGRAA